MGFILEEDLHYQPYKWAWDNYKNIWTIFGFVSKRSLE